jgi:hypothetical protein
MPIEYTIKWTPIISSPSIVEGEEKGEGGSHLTLTLTPLRRRG